MLNFLTSSRLTFLPEPPILASCLFLEQTNFQSQAFGGSFQFLCGSAGKEFACNAGDLGSIPGSGRSAGEGKVHPLQNSGLENSMGQSMGLQRVRHDWVTFTFQCLELSSLSSLSDCSLPRSYHKFHPLMEFVLLVHSDYSSLFQLLCSTILFFSLRSTYCSLLLSLSSFCLHKSRVRIYFFHCYVSPETNQSIIVLN